MVEGVIEERALTGAGGTRGAPPRRRLRVLQITENLGVGGLERVVATLCREMDPERFEPSVLCMRAGGPIADELRELGFKVHVLPWSRENIDYFAFRKVAAILRKERIDVIHTHNSLALFDGTAAALLAGVRTHVHTDHARDFPDRLRYMVGEHLCSYHVYRFVGVSEHTTRNLIRYERISKSRLRTVPNGILPPQAPRDFVPGAKRRELGIPEGVPIIGTMGRLMPQKGLEFLVRAAALLRQRIPHFVVLIAGDGDERKRLEDQVRELGLEEHVRLLGLRLDIPELLRIFDIYALPSRWEGLPMAVLESMAAGVPLVASKVGGVPTAVREGRSGILVPPCQEAPLADALAALILDPDRRRRLGRGAREIFEAEFTAARMTRRYERMYLRQDP